MIYVKSITTLKDFEVNPYQNEEFHVKVESLNKFSNLRSLSITLVNLKNCHFNGLTNLKELRMVIMEKSKLKSYRLNGLENLKLLEIKKRHFYYKSKSMGYG